MFWKVNKNASFTQGFEHVRGLATRRGCSVRLVMSYVIPKLNVAKLGRCGDQTGIVVLGAPLQENHQCPGTA